MTDAEPSPVWVPDSEAPTCMHCLKSEFTVINRRVSTRVTLRVDSSAVAQVSDSGHDSVV